MLSAILVASIAVAVILGYKTKINTGFFCIAFAYLIGCFGMGLKTKELIGFWPVSTMFVILSVSLFYNFAAVNGTLEKMSASLLYMCRKFPGMLPFALFFVAVLCKYCFSFLQAEIFPARYNRLANCAGLV